jgi:hypothetical protein
MQLDRLEGGADFMEPIFATLEDLELEIQLGARGKRECQRWMDFSPARYLTDRSR